MAHSQGRRPPELGVPLDRRIAHRLGQGRQLGQAVQPLTRPAKGGEGVVAGREEDPPVGRRRHDRERLLDEPERLLGGVRGERGGGGIDREAGRPDRVPGRQGVLGEHRQPGGIRIAAFQQQVDHRGVDLPPSGRRQLVDGELADLLMGERVVRGLALGLRQQEARPDRRPEIVGEPVRLVAGARRLARSSPPRSAGRGLVAGRHLRRDHRLRRPAGGPPARSRRLKLRPRIAASPSAARVRAGRRAARRSIRVRTADGTSRAALRPSRHSPSTC